MEEEIGESGSRDLGGCEGIIVRLGEDDKERMECSQCGRERTPEQSEWSKVPKGARAAETFCLLLKVLVVD